MHFQIAVNLIRTFSYVNFPHVFIYTLRFHMYFRHILFCLWHYLRVSGIKPPEKSLPWGVRGRVRVRLGIGLSLESGGFFPRGDFFPRTLFLCHLLPPYEVCESIVCISVCHLFCLPPRLCQLQVSILPRNLIVIK